MSESSPECLAERAADGLLTALCNLIRPWLIRVLRSALGAGEQASTDDEIERKAEGWVNKRRAPQRQRSPSPGKRTRD